MSDTLMTTITTPVLGTVAIPIDALASLLGKRFLTPKTSDVLPCTKPDYKGKNISGGRKCIFSQSTAYKSRERQAKRDAKYQKEK